ncbi:hypothetical protein GQS52_24975 [Streptomyces sp. SCUT-3]|uniref:hypothetical protein n=1 Tax=Streptomyces TaxID=1883 RepID=UPI000CBD1155|nr:hypothetical protein [Streptomyces sp. SCUT-3]PLW66193.1 hypothetical protein C0036_24055 [Streptomyces sp. DJ]QMV24486.1 hypothetical protein GQS52_24975 [Streptomyces sp. SCUT-3]
MRPTAVRRTALAACAASLALLVTACGGSEPAGDDKDEAAPGKSAAAEPAAEAPTAAELEELALAEGDVKDQEVKKAGADDAVPAKVLTVGEKACEPVARVLFNAPVGDPGATVRRVATGKATEKQKDVSIEDLADMTEEEAEKALASTMSITKTVVSLSSYDGKGAEDAFDALSAAGTDCADGFAVTVAGAKQKVTGIEKESITGGEESLAWTVTVEQEGETMPFKVAVVRRGAALASFSAFNLTAAGGEDYELPQTLVKAQVGKLG